MTQRSYIEQAMEHPSDECFIEELKEKTILCIEEIDEKNDYAMTQAIAALIDSVHQDGQGIFLGMVCGLEEALCQYQSRCRFYTCVSDSENQYAVTIPEGQYLCTYHHGQYETLNVTYKKLYSYAQLHNMKVGDRIYSEAVIGDWAVQSSSDYVIKVFVPIANCSYSKDTVRRK